jgi:predicted house-cleaning noncanonical NTP pyrophosphatase (MazG superfamily)
MIIKYDKLVRDKIPEIIENSNKEFQIHTVDEKATIQYLIKKFDEELAEFKEAYSKEELADVLELIHGLAYQLDYDMEEIEAIRQDKHEKRGGFEQRIVLDHVIE